MKRIGIRFVLNAADLHVYGRTARHVKSAASLAGFLTRHALRGARPSAFRSSRRATSTATLRASRPTASSPPASHCSAARATAARDTGPRSQRPRAANQRSRGMPACSRLAFCAERGEASPRGRRREPDRRSGALLQGGIHRPGSSHTP